MIAMTMIGSTVSLTRIAEFLATKQAYPHREYGSQGIEANGVRLNAIMNARMRVWGPLHDQTCFQGRADDTKKLVGLGEALS